MGIFWLTSPNLLRSQGLRTYETASRLSLSLHGESWHPNGFRQVISCFTNARTPTTIRYHFGWQVRNQVDGIWKRETQGVKNLRQKLMIVSTRYRLISPRCQTWEEATNYTSTPLETIEEDKTRYEEILENRKHALVILCCLIVCQQHWHKKSDCCLLSNTFLFLESSFLVHNMGNYLLNVQFVFIDHLPTNHNIIDISA